MADNWVKVLGIVLAAGYLLSRRPDVSELSVPCGDCWKRLQNDGCGDCGGCQGAAPYPRLYAQSGLPTADVPLPYGDALNHFPANVSAN